MFGQSRFVTKGSIIIVVLLVIGTARADDPAVDDNHLQKIVMTSSYVSGTQVSQPSTSSDDSMEEVVVSMTRNAIDPLVIDIKKSALYEFDVEFLPERNSKNIADHSELTRLDDRYGRTGFIEVFRVRFGRK